MSSSTINTLEEIKLLKRCSFVKDEETEPPCPHTHTSNVLKTTQFCYEDFSLGFLGFLFLPQNLCFFLLFKSEVTWFYGYMSSQQLKNILFK